MKKILLLTVLLFCCICVSAQFKVSTPRSWDNMPPGIQKGGLGFFKSVIVQMDDDAEEEEVFLFTGNNGHYPYFDLFKISYAVVGYYSKQIKYVSDITLSTSRDLILEDRNKDGKFELYRKYIKDGKFTVDKEGNNLRAEWVYDTIDFQTPKK